MDGWMEINKSDGACAFCCSTTAAGSTLHVTFVDATASLGWMTMTSKRKRSLVTTTDDDDDDDGWSTNSSSTVAGAQYLASIFGTEKDRVNCSFYFKVGACRHGDKCSRLHNRPTYSQTLLLTNLYPTHRLDHASSSQVAQAQFDDFFQEVFEELEDCYGRVEELNVCDNIGEHMIGNVYVKFRYESDADRALAGVVDRWFAGAPIHAELSPVSDFRDACCRQYEMGECTRGGFCNFLHLKPISHELRRYLYNRKRKKHRRSRNAPAVIDNLCNREQLPRTYQHHDSSSSSDNDESTNTSNKSRVPIAFQSRQSTSSSGSDDSIDDYLKSNIHKYSTTHRSAQLLQIRKDRWKQMQQQLQLTTKTLGDDDAREQNYVFSLL